MKNKALLAFFLVAILSGCGPLRKITSPLPSSRTVDNVYQPSIVIEEGRKAPDVVSVPAPKIEEPVKPIPTKEARTKQEKIIKIAKSKLGCKYQYAGKGPNSFDCSGFTGFVFRQVGINLGASSRDQFSDGRPIAKGEDLRPGDLVFFNGRKIGTTIGHVGIVVDYKKSTGEFTFIHAAVSTGVELQKSTAEYYSRRYMGARRVLPEKMGREEEVAEVEEEEKPNPPLTFTASIEPMTVAETPASQEPEPVYHTIKSGDTLSALAVKYHTTVNKICSLNGITPKTILKIGRKLRMK